MKKEGKNAIIRPLLPLFARRSLLLSASKRESFGRSLIQFIVPRMVYGALFIYY